MNKLQKALCIGTTVLALAGCAQYKTGEIIKEYGGDSNRLIPSQINGFFISGETVKIGNSYVLQIRTKDGDYTASIKEDGPPPVVTLEALSIVIKEGDKIKFPTTNSLGIDRFNTNKIGIIYSDDIEILSPRE